MTYCGLICYIITESTSMICSEAISYFPPDCLYLHALNYLHLDEWTVSHIAIESHF